METTDHPFIACLNEIYDFASESARDFDRSYREMKANPADMYWRRTAIRSFTAHVEGVVYLMKRAVLQLAPITAVTLSEGERAYLREDSFVMRGDGSVEEHPGKWPAMISNMRFTFACYCKVNHCTAKITYEGNGFACFKELIKVRNRLTHPKGTASLRISDEESKRFVKAVIWFQKHWDKVMEDSMAACTAYVKAKSKKEPMDRKV